MTKHTNPFASHEAFAEHMRRHEEFDEWLAERTQVLGYSYGLENFDLTSEGVSVTFDSWGGYDEIIFSWDELTDETGETRRRTKEERDRKRRERHEREKREAREAAVRRLERQLELAREELEKNR